MLEVSERKTTEIKLRVTPAEKNAWQFAAEEDGVGLSEFARRAMNERAQQRPRTFRHPVGDRFVAPVSTSSEVDLVDEPKPWMFGGGKSG